MCWSSNILLFLLFEEWWPDGPVPHALIPIRVVRSTTFARNKHISNERCKKGKDEPTEGAAEEEEEEQFDDEDIENERKNCRNGSRK